jgi:eukaryotic-like serine/threonine-protein kinase
MPAVAPAPVPVPPVPATTQPATSEPAPARKWIAIAIGAVVVLVILALLLLRGGGGGGIDVINLSAGERLYINGLRMDSTPHVDKPGALLVSTAVDGRLRRFGRTERRDRIDVRTIPEALPQQGTGTLSVAGDPACRVKVGNDMLSGNTPLKAPIEAGKELEVLVNCPSGVLSASVMVVSGQEVEIDARSKK